MPLKAEEREDILAMSMGDGYRAFQKLMAEVERRVQLDVLNCDLAVSDERELVRRKCRAEGASKFVRLLSQEVERLKPRTK